MFAVTGSAVMTSLMMLLLSHLPFGGPMTTTLKTAPD
jgi:hypothetical protein